MPALRDAPLPARYRTEPTTADYVRLFTLSQDLLTIAGLDGYFRKVNPAWTRVTGWSEEELLARPVSFFMHPDDRERTLAARADLAQGIPVRGLENRYLCKDGSYRWLSWQSSVETADGMVFAVARDITERRQLEHERLIVSKLESTGILAGGIAHDFNNLLGGLLLNLHMIAITGPMTPEQQDQLRRAREAVNGAAALTQQLLTFAKGGDAARRVCEIKPLVQRSVDLALSGSNIRGVCAFAPDLWAAEVDEAQISQVVRNVVLNAREAMPAGGTVWVTAANVAAEERRPEGDDAVRITIVDEGAGIPGDVLPKIFDPYFSTKPRGSQKGMGLGLTICRTVVQKHGGTIQVDSRPGAGTMVTLTLPATRKAAVATPTPVTLAPQVQPGARKLLVMDDEPMFREVVAEAMQLYGYRVEMATNGDEAIGVYERAHAAGDPFDAVVLDLTVRGGMGGAETMRLLSARYPGIRGILMTGYSSEQTFRDYAEHGFSAALGKPFSAEALHAALSVVLQRDNG